jgi:hypothetical protein
MVRTPVTDESGEQISWFDPEAAVKVSETTFWNGNNHISRATRSQWNHEALYITRKGRMVLNHWSQWQGSVESYIEISVDQAAQWLIQVEQTEADELDHNRVPASLRKAIAAQVENAEI